MTFLIKSMLTISFIFIIPDQSWHDLMIIELQQGFAII